MQTAKDLAGLVVNQHDVYIYLAGLGARAGEFLQNVGIDLVIASQELPDMTGMELFADLSRSHPAVGRVLLLSGEEGVDAHEAVRRGLIDYYMVEPMDDSAFMNILRDIARRDSPAGELHDGASAPGFMPPIPSAGGDLESIHECARPISGPAVSEEKAGIVTPDEPKRPESPWGSPDHGMGLFEGRDTALEGPALNEQNRADGGEGGVGNDAPELPVFAEVDATASLKSPEELENLIQAAEGGPAIPLWDGTDMKAGVGPAGDGKGEAAPLDHQRAGEGFSSDLTMGGIVRIGPLQESQQGLIRENEQLRSLIEGLRGENAALMIARQENNLMPEKNAGLSREKELLEQQVAGMGSEIQRLQTELRQAREQLSKSRSQSESDQRLRTPIDLRHRHDPMEIYEKAAELDRQLCQARQSNSMLALNLSTRERELSSAKEELDRLGKSLEDGGRRFKKELLEYQKNCAFLKEAVETCQSRRESLERENARLLKKLSWVQTEWNQFLESHKRSGDASIE
jgi:predicted  nucleic acid-binding Zn-ribbon protein